MSEYINREDALNLDFRINVNMFESRLKTAERAVQAYADAIDKIPAADVRPVVKAHWYWDKDGMDWNIGAWRCSACKAMSPMWWNTDRGSPMHKSGHNYCPNCGADMREQPKEE